MHDPMTQAWQLRFPWWTHRPWPRGVKKFEDMTPRQQRSRSKMFKEGYREAWLTIWHVDPCKGPGGDDSCGWFKRSYHGDPDVLERIVKRFEWDWDRVFKSDSGKEYFCGYFYPEDAGAGMPNMGVSAIVLNLFFMAVGEHFESYGYDNWKMARRWMQKHLFDILLFAENPTDSLRDSIVRKWGTDTKREERIRSVASCIYGYILREEQKWWQHPRWHIHHWKIDWHFGYRLMRWWKRRCKKCGGRISVKDNGVVADGFSDSAPLTCGKCSGSRVVACEAKA